MASRSSSTPSEGEIVESGSEKATTRSVNVPNTNVDRPFRKHASISRSPSPIQSPRYHRSRTRSRSPYREPRGAKRVYEDEVHRDHTRDDPRRFKIRYEGRPFEDRRRPHGLYEDLDRSGVAGPRLRYDEHRTNARPRDKRRRTRSRSPRHRISASEEGRHANGNRKAQQDSRSWGDRNGREHHGGRSRLSTEQSVSDRGHPSVATANTKQDAETPMIQSIRAIGSGLEPQAATAEYVLLWSFFSC